MIRRDDGANSRVTNSVMISPQPALNIHQLQGKQNKTNQTTILIKTTTTTTTTITTTTKKKEEEEEEEA
jgi:hypothetical protein